VRLAGLTIVVALALAFGARPAVAQILSPGPLAEPHAELEGLRSCTDCHELGTRGIAADRCLACHEALRSRVEAGQGYHATVSAEACADCHQDHLGRDLDLLRIDEASFPHEDTGYPLVLSHAEVSCRDCHSSGHVVAPDVRRLKSERGALDRTFLGLAPDCASCHAVESPHEDELADRTCSECHDEGEWLEAPVFDHSRARFALDGLHLDVACAECHDSGPDARYRPLPFVSCADCHQDPHVGAMRGECASCHRTVGWARLTTAAVDAGFDHGKTTFPLVGAHATAACEACHQRGRPPRGEVLHMTYRAGTADRTYPVPVGETCASCHVDRHAWPDAGGRWAGCADCHAEAVWSPSRFGLERHGAEATFALTGSHLAVPCVACHEDASRGHERFTLALGPTDCRACHESDDPHEGRYGDLACEACHGTESFDEVGYIHPAPELVTRTCASCHQADDPHRGQFDGRDCADCHTVESFLVEGFDHGRTRFPLDGAHERASCAVCHAAEAGDGAPFVRYRPLGVECTDCHQEVT
jgi:hypothetical protein